MDSSSFLAFPLNHLPFVVIVMVLAFTFHEFAHAYTAHRFGDPTPDQMGRVTLNPRAHLDIFGTLLLFIAGFGWAKPVLVNRSRFKYPRLMGIIVSFAGPFSNLLMAFIGTFLVYLFTQLGWFNGTNVGVNDALHVFFGYLISLNLLLFLFNMIPLPPLDGYRIIADLAPLNLRMRLARFEQWGMYIFLLLVFIPPLSSMTIGPLFGLSKPIFDAFQGWLNQWFGPIVNWSKF